MWLPESEAHNTRVMREGGKNTSKQSNSNSTYMTHDILSTGPDICFVFLFISGKDLNVTVDIKWEVEPSRYEVYILDSFLHTYIIQQAVNCLHR